MKLVRQLGSQFIAFLSGALLATGLAVVTTTFLQERQPARYGLLLVSGALVSFGGVLYAWISVLAGDIEALDAHESDPTQKQALWQSQGGRFRVLLLTGAVMTLSGLAFLPARLAWTGWPHTTSERCVPLTNAPNTTGQVPSPARPC